MHEEWTVRIMKKRDMLLDVSKIHFAQNMGWYSHQVRSYCEVRNLHSSLLRAQKSRMCIGYTPYIVFGLRRSTPELASTDKDG